jgi:hypothetical protein
MTARRCNRFEQEGLLRKERGLPMDEHYATCPDCLAAMKDFQRIQTALASTEALPEPKAGWETRVLGMVDALPIPTTHTRWSWRWLPAFAAAAAAAVLAIVFVARGPAPVAPLGLELGRQKGEVVQRGEGYQPGDTLTIRASTGGARYAEVRVYLNGGELLLRCSAEQPCVREGDWLRAEVKLPAVGRYQVLLLASDRELPAGHATLDQDGSEALSAGAQVLVEEITVY